MQSSDESLNASSTISPNSAQIELWNGRGGEIWTRLQTRLDELFEPLTEALLAATAAKAGESVVEIGCGCGDLTLALAEACGPAGRILAVDVSTPMLDHAKSREKDFRQMESGSKAPARIDRLEADAMLHPFEPDADLVTSRFGVMFFDDPVAAFTNIRQATKPGGRLVFLSWADIEDNDWMALPLAAIRELIEPPAPLPVGSPGPFAFADARRVEGILRDAGFARVTSQSIERRVVLGRARTLEGYAEQLAIEDALPLALQLGAVAALLRDADDAMLAKARATIAAALRPHFDPQSMEIAFRASCWLYQASTDRI